MILLQEIVAKWSEVVEKGWNSILAFEVVLFAETNAQIFKSDGTYIYKHLLLKDLAIDPSTQIENDPCQPGGNDQSNSLRQGDTAVNSHLASPNSTDGDRLMDNLGSLPDLASLEAKIMAHEAAVNDFLYTYYGS